VPMYDTVPDDKCANVRHCSRW